MFSMRPTCSSKFETHHRYTISWLLVRYNGLQKHTSVHLPDAGELPGSQCIKTKALTDKAKDGVTVAQLVTAAVHALRRCNDTQT